MSPFAVRAAFFAFLLLSSLSAFGQILVITTLDDATSRGTLRDAINQRNACTAGCPSIEFNIANDPGCTTTQCVIRLDPNLGALPTLFGTPSYVIDGSTQPGGLGIVIDGSALAVAADGLVIGTTSTTLTKLGIVGFANGAGVRVPLAGSSFVVQASSIGADWDGVAAGNGTGVLVETGVTSGRVDQTLIANNAGSGIQLGTSDIDDTIQNIRMTALSVFDNGGLGIDFGGGGVPTPNDVDDPDTGPNGRLNFPVIDSVTFDLSGQATISGSLDLSPSSSFAPVTIHVYGSTSADPSGFGEGEQLLATLALSTDVNGDILAWSTTPVAVPAGVTSYTATATLEDFSLNIQATSEFSAAVTAVFVQDIGITKSGPASAFISAPMSYTLTVQNFGPDAPNVTVTDTLPAGSTFSSVGASSLNGTVWTCAQSSPGVVTCTTQTMVDSDTSTITIVAFAPPTLGVAVNTVTVSTTGTDTDPNNNGDSVSTTITSAEVAIDKTASPDPVRLGQPLTYTVVVSNSGTAPATAVQVTDTLDPNVAFVSAGNADWSCALSGSNVVCTYVGGTPAGSLIGTSSFPIVVTPTAVGTVTNTAFVATEVPETNFLDNSFILTTTVNASGADLKLDKSGPASAEPGDAFTYVLTVTNLGPTAAPDVTVTDTLPAGVTFIDTFSLNWSCFEDSPGTIICALMSVPLASGASASLALNVQGPDFDTTVTNTATVASTADPDTSNNTASATTTFVTPCPDDPPVLVAPAPGASNVTSPVEFRWRAIADAFGYQLFIDTLGGTQLLGSIDGSAPANEEMTFVSNVPEGRVIWWVRARLGNCGFLDSAQQIFFSDRCPDEAPALLEIVHGTQGAVTLRWTRLDQALRYHVYLSRDDQGLENIGTVEQVAEGMVPSFQTTVPSGATIGWVIEAELGGECPRLRSAPGEFQAPCYPPVLSIPGTVTSEQEYQVRATIVSVGRNYIFEESTSELFDRDLVSKQGQLHPDNEYTFAIFEHVADEPTAYFYRTRVDQPGCEFSDPGRIVVIPPSKDSVFQLDLEETIVRQVEILSPPEELGSGFTFQVTDDREWILDVTPSNGTIGPNEVLILTVTMNPVGLPVGTTTGTIEVEFTPIEPAGKRALSNHSVRSSTSVSITLVTPVTNTGKGTPVAESLIIPAVAHADGFNSQWQSDSRLVNLGTTSQKYALNFTLSGENGTQTGKSAEIDLAPGQTTALNDLVRQWFGLGSLPGENATGILEIRPLARGAIASGQTSVTKSLVSVASSRTYNTTAQGTLGQFIPAIPFAGFVGKTPPEATAQSILSLQQLAQNDGFRTNFGMAEASGNPATVAVRFYDANATELVALSITLQAGEHLQINEILEKNGVTDLDTGRAELEVVEGDGRITAYASVVDNLTNDPLLVRAVNLAEIGADKYVLPGVAHYETGLASWRSDMQIFSADAAPVQATLSFFRQGETTPAQTAQMTFQPRTITSLGNVLATVFGESNTGGSVHVTTTGTSKLVVTARTYDQTESGTYGQFIPAVTEAEAFGLGDRPMQVLQMEQSPNFRTNLGIVEVTGQPVQIELTAHVAESRVTPRVQLTLQGNEFRQLDGVLQSLNVGNTYNARVGLRVIGGQGKIVAYGSAVDNRTQDPTYVPGQ